MYLSFKDISNFSSGGHYVQRSRLVFANFVEEQFCEIILMEEMSFIDISIFSSCGHIFQQSKMVCSVLVEGIITNTSVKSY